MAKFRTYCKETNEFCYSNGRGQQFIGILDSNMREIYERDVVKFFDYYGEQIGEVMYSADKCAYCIDYCPIMNLNLDSLEVVGNMDQDYHYNENGDLVKK